MRSKLLKILVATALTVLMLTALTSCQKEVEFEFRVVDGGCEIVSASFPFFRDVEEVVIPAEYHGLKTVSIGEGAFMFAPAVPIHIPETVRSIGASAFYASGFSAINLPPALESIGEQAFMGCENLPAITIPATVNEIGTGAFAGCASLSSCTVAEGNTAYTVKDGHLYTKDEKALVHYVAKSSQAELTIPEGTEAIHDFAFYYCEKLESIHLPDSVKEIGDFAFLGCKALKSINIPEGVTTFGDGLFNECISLTSLSLPASLENVGYDSFLGCTLLSAFTVHEDNEHYAVIDGNLYTKDKKTLVQYAPGKKETAFVTPLGVKFIGDSAFYGNAVLEKVTLPEGLDRIDAYAFSDCYQLKEVVFPTTLKAIERCAFEDCVSLTLAVLPPSLLQIGEYAFRGCSSLISVHIPASVVEIGRGAFFACPELTIYAEAAERPDGWHRKYKRRLRTRTYWEQ